MHGNQPWVLGTYSTLNPIHLLVSDGLGMYLLGKAIISMDLRSSQVQQGTLLLVSHTGASWSALNEQGRQLLYN